MTGRAPRPATGAGIPIISSVYSARNRYGLGERGADDLAMPGIPHSEVAGRSGATARHVALAWLLRCSPVDHLGAYVAAADTVFGDAEMRALDAA